MKNIKFVIYLGLAITILCGSVVHSQTVQRQVDSLFVLASSGEVIHQHMVEPARDSIAALGAEAVPFLVEKFTTKSARERHTIVQILKKIGSPAVPFLLESLQHEDGMVVQRVCWALGDIKDTAATEGLIAISNHSRWQVRDQALGALGDLADARGQQAVTAGLADSIGLVRKSAAVATGKIELNDLVLPLMTMLNDDFYGARMSAANALLRLDTTTVILAVEEVLLMPVDSTDKLRANLCCWVLGQLASGDALDILHEQTKSFSIERRTHAGVALAEADPSDHCGYVKMALENETDPMARMKIETALAAGKAKLTGE